MNNSHKLPLTLSITALVVALAAALMMVLNLRGDAEESAPVSEVFRQSDEAGYSMASRYGDLVWTAGHLPDAEIAPADVEAQTELVMEALEDTLEEAGAGFDTVLMTNVYLKDFGQWVEFNTVYSTYFEGRLPPRVTVQISDLGFGDIEISMVAHVRST